MQRSDPAAPPLPPRCRALFALAFIRSLLVISAMIILIVWLVRRSQAQCQAQDPEFRVDSFSLSRNDSSSTSFAIGVQLTAQNPNKELDLSFSRADAIVFYRSSSLASTVMPPFSLDKKSQAPLTASFPAVAGNLVERDVAGFDLRMYLSSEEKKKKKSTIFRVFCGGLLVAIPRNGSLEGGLTGGPRPCQVEKG